MSMVRTVQYRTWTDSVVLLQPHAYKTCLERIKTHTSGKTTITFFDNCLLLLSVIDVDE